jgi:dimethyl sulfoxide reductase iron-sulfur subunit
MKRKGGVMHEPTTDPVTGEEGVIKQDESHDAPVGRVSRRGMFGSPAAAGMAAAATTAAAGAGGLLSLLKTDRVQAASHSQSSSKRQWAMIIDLRKCEGCITIDKPAQCVEACQKAHHLPEGQQWIRVVKERDEHGMAFFRPLLCMQCENAPCVRVCPVGANFHNASGVVLVDHNKCIGCRMCMAACPYDARVFNWSEPQNPPEATFASYSPEFPLPHRKGTVSKCMLCAHNAAKGQLPACSTGCPMKAVYLGDLVSDVATNGQEVVRLSTFLSENHGYRYKEELGTRSRVYYIPGHGEAFGLKAEKAPPHAPPASRRPAAPASPAERRA